MVDTGELPASGGYQHVGLVHEHVLTRSVRDTAAVLDAVSGPMPGDPYVASARFDGMLSLRAARSVDAAAGQLIVLEAGGSVAFPDVAGEAVPLDLGMRSRGLLVGAGLVDRLASANGRTAPSASTYRIPFRDSPAAAAMNTALVSSATTSAPSVTSKRVL